MCLPHVLQAALVLQSSTVVLECVQQAAEDVFVKTCLEAFCEAADFVYTEVLLDLSSVWAAKRARWWCILTPAQLGRCHVRTWPVCDNCVTVEEVLQYTWPLTPELDSLRLTPYELRQFSSRNPMSTYLLPSDRPMPTSLHSAACQVFPCPCGCRQAPFTLERLDQGLHAVLTVCHGGDQRHAGEFRHLAPAEMALLNGLSPKGPCKPRPRLADCLIGQLASPLQSGWIFAHLRGFVGSIWPQDCPGLSPMEFLATARTTLLAEAAELGLRGPSATGDGNPPAVVSEAPLAPAEPAHDVEPPVLAEVVDLPESPQEIPPTTGLPLPAPALPEVQVEAVAAVAEVGEDEWGRYRQDASKTRAAPYHVGHGGTRMREVEATEATPALQLALNACSHQFVPWQLRDRHDVYVSHDHRVQPGEILRFTHVAEVEGISLPLAFVMPPVSEVHLLLRPAVTCRERARLLCRQQARLADDQIAYALRELRAKLDTPLAVLEPAHLLAAVQQRKDTVLRELLAPIRLAANFVVVSALPLGGHWVTFAWVCDADHVAAWNSYAIRQWDDMISTANWLLSHALQRSLDQYRFLDGPVRPLHGPHCGQFALDDLDCFVRGVPFRQDADILRHYAQLPAGLLPPSNAGLVPLPTCVASGQDLLEAGLATTLRTRGVPEGQARARAVAAIQALGAGRL